MVVGFVECRSLEKAVLVKVVSFGLTSDATAFMLAALAAAFAFSHICLV